MKKKRDYKRERRIINRNIYIKGENYWKVKRGEERPIFQDTLDRLNNLFK